MIVPRSEGDPAASRRAVEQRRVDVEGFGTRKIAVQDPCRGGVVDVLDIDVVTEFDCEGLSGSENLVFGGLDQSDLG